MNVCQNLDQKIEDLIRIADTLNDGNFSKERTDADIMSAAKNFIAMRKSRRDIIQAIEDLEFDILDYKLKFRSALLAKTLQNVFMAQEERKNNPRPEVRTLKLLDRLLDVGTRGDQFIKLKIEGRNDFKIEEIEAIAKALKHIPILTLNMPDNNLGDQGVKLLAENLNTSQLIHINLEGNQIGPEGIKYLAKTCNRINLNTLNLKNNELRDRGVEVLTKSLNGRRLAGLILSKNHIGDQGAKFLADWLKNTNVVQLDLQTNPIEEAGAQYLADGLKDNKLKVLHMAATAIGSVGQKYFYDARQELSKSGRDVDVYVF